MLDIYFSHVLVVAGLVWVLMVVLNKLFYKPIGTILEEREAKVTRENEELDVLSASVTERTGTLEKKLKDARRRAAKTREALLQKGENIKADTISTARENARKTFDARMAELDSEIDLARVELEKHIETFSGMIKETFIG